MHRLIPAALWLLWLAPVRAQDVDPQPPGPLLGPVLQRWSFDRDLAGWNAAHDCQAAAASGQMRITCTGQDPYLIARLPSPLGGPLMARIRMRAATQGAGQFFWASDQQPKMGPAQCVTFPVEHDGQWHEYSALVEFPGKLTHLRLDPGAAAGQVEVEWIELVQARLYPLQIERIAASPAAIEVELRNRSARRVEGSVSGQALAIAPGAVGRATCPLKLDAPFAAVPLVIQVPDFPELRRTLVLHQPLPTGDWPACRSAKLAVRIAPDGSGACVEREGRTVAVIAPLVWRQERIVKLAIAQRKPDGVRLQGQGCQVSLDVREEEIEIALGADEDVEGPVVRPLGVLQQGLLAGLEYLGRGERSSSTLDLETDEHLRFVPDPLKLTLPLAACVTDRAAVALTWNDMQLQPTFACPNFVDGMPLEQRMSLRGRRIEAVLRVSGQSLEELIVWAVRRRGLPPLPPAPRDPQAQRQLALAAIQGPIAGPGGWGHCAEEKWARHPYADVASALFRLTGQVPKLDTIVSGGAHVRNDAVYFLSRQAEPWLEIRRREARGLIAAQKPDGSFRYQGPFQRGHYEDTSSGHCALPAVHLLEFARLTGDPDALQAGLKTLDYMKRFQVPRGAQTWELSLHTPDVLASAYLVWAYVRGYELTGQAQYLAEARRWAASGIPFVYLWQRLPIMLYTTPPVYGATNYRAPNWMGLPVLWCGGVYAYALTLLAPHDATLDWKHLAQGIFVAAQQVQYPDGPLAGCLPDVFHLAPQQRDGPSINPAALVSLQWVLEGRLDGLAAAGDGRHRVAAPFPVTLRGDRAILAAQPGLDYQILLDGRVVDVRGSKGEDVVPLEESKSEIRISKSETKSKPEISKQRSP